MRLLERYRQEHERIEALLDHWFRDFTFLFGSVEAPASIRTRIDDVFAGPGLPPTRELALALPEGFGDFEEDRQLILQTLDGQGKRASTTREDLQKLHAGIEYLRHVDGEKHLVYVTPDGMEELGAYRADRLAAMAADARVTLSPIQTAGLPLWWDYSTRPPTLVGRSWSQLFAIRDLRAMAEETGGMPSFYRYADEALAALDGATRFHYVLGYYPADPALDSAYRRVAVRVARRDVKVLHRRGYYAYESEAPYDPRAARVRSRIRTAAGHWRELGDLAVAASAGRAPAGAGEVVVTLTIGVGEVAFAEADGRFTATLEVAVFAGGAREAVVGEVWQTLDLSFDAAGLARVRREGLVHTARVPVEAHARHVRAVAYDPAADRLGTTTITLR